MKRITLILLSILIVGNAFAQKAPTTKLISSSEGRIVVRVELNGFSTNKVQTPQGEQFTVSVPKMAAMLEAGNPDLPTLPIPAIIGDQAEMTVNVIDAQYTDFANTSIAPSKGNISRQVNPDDVPYTYGAMYQENAFWPATQAYLEAPYILRDFRGQNIMVRPFAYNPVTHTLRVYDNLTIEMKKVSDNGLNQKATRRSNTIKVDPEQRAQYDRRFINFEAAQAKYQFDEDYGELLIICTDAYLENMQPLVEWKNKSGRPTTLVSLSEAGGNNANNIKNYITNFYNDPSHNLEFILLVGEYNDLLPYSISYDKKSDNWFGKLEGNDDYLDALVGRLSVTNAADVDVQVNKIISYERDVTSEITWGNKGLGIGHMTDGPGHYNEYDYQHIHYISDSLTHYTYAQVSELHGGSGGSASTSTISAAINEGVSIINYCNHGSTVSWGVANYSTSNVATLTNDNKLPFIWSVACENGQFDTGTCFGESWLRASNNSTGAPTGAVGGMFSWISQPWTPPMYGQDEMVDILTEWRSVDQYCHTLGGASLNGSMYILDAEPNDSYETFNTWLLFGDPSLLVRTDNPVAMNVSTSPAVLMVGMTELNINAGTECGIATLSMNGETIATSRIINNQCTLTFPALTNVGTADLVIIGYNKETYCGSVNIIVAEGAYITMDAYEINADQANYGETIDMNINIKNVGVEIANNLTATLATSSEYVEILAGESTVTSMNPDEIATMEGFQFKVAENVPDKTNAEFTLTVTDGTDTWENTFVIQLHAPVVAFESIEQYQGQNNENCISFKFKNTGSAPFYGGVLDIYSSSTDIVFDTPHLVFNDTIRSDRSIDLTTTYTVDPSVELGSTYEIAYEMSSGLNKVSGIYILSVGAIQEDFESGAFGDNWSLSTQYPWAIAEGGAKGNYCAKSGNQYMSSSESSMELTVDVLAAGELTFMYKVSSETNYDKLYFYMDNQEKGNWSGNVDWSQFTQPVTVGTHTFKWSYAKDVSVNSNEDCAWVDDIIFPPTSVVNFLHPVRDLHADVDDTSITLSWMPSSDASSYIVMRDGEEIGRVSEDSFTEVVDYGNYDYCVIATNDEGHFSTPSFVSVLVEDITGVAENSLTFQVYPNPANSTLFIKGIDTSYHYAMYNNMGQQVACGQAQGLKQIDVNGMAKGVYFLRITNGSQVNVQKVIVE